MTAKYAVFFTNVTRNSSCWSNYYKTKVNLCYILLFTEIYIVCTIK